MDNFYIEWRDICRCIDRLCDNIEDAEFDYVKGLFLDAPAIRVPVRLRRGKWTKVSGYVTPGGDPVWECSECSKGRHTYGIEHGTYGADIADGQWVSCPNCAAIMEGDPE